MRNVLDRRWNRLALVALVGLGACGRSAEPRARWVASWAASPQPADAPLQLAGQTVRQVVRVSLGGQRVRVRLSNAYGTTSLRVGAAHLALHARGPAIVAGSDRT